VHHDIDGNRCCALAPRKPSLIPFTPDAGASRYKHLCYHSQARLPAYCIICQITTHQSNTSKPAKLQKSQISERAITWLFGSAPHGCKARRHNDNPESGTRVVAADPGYAVPTAKWSGCFYCIFSWQGIACAGGKQRQVIIRNFKFSNQQRVASAGIMPPATRASGIANPFLNVQHRNRAHIAKRLHVYTSKGTFNEVAKCMHVVETTVGEAHPVASREEKKTCHS
jgi:hypothetical protein